MIALVCPVSFTWYFFGLQAEEHRAAGAGAHWGFTEGGGRAAQEEWSQLQSCTSRKWVCNLLMVWNLFLPTSYTWLLLGDKPNKLSFFKGQPPKKHVLSSTIPKEFNFCSDNRVKNHTEASEASYKEYDFTSQLRKHPSSPVSINSESRFEHLSGVLSQNF